jgi:hypothetical protein
MEDRAEKIFKWIWRANGVVLFVLSISGLIAVALLVVNLGIFASRERPEEKITEIAGTSIDYKTLRFGDFSEIKGTSFLYAPLGTQSQYIGSGSSGGIANSRNLLFFDTKTQKAHWLLKNNNEAIQTLSFLTDPPECEYRGAAYSECEASRVAIALLLEFESEPQSGKGSKSSRRIAIAAPDGTDMRELVTGADGLLGFHSLDGTKTIVFYAKGGAVRFLNLDPTKRILRSDEILSAQD